MRLFGFIYLFIVFVKAYGQTDSVWQWTWSEVGCAGVKPQIKAEHPEGFRYIHVPYFNSVGGHEAFETFDRDFVVVFTINHYPITPQDSLLVLALNPNFPQISMDSLYLHAVENDLKFAMGNRFKSLKNCPVKYYSVKNAKMKFNADHALTYSFTFTKDRRFHELEKKYCRVLVLHKTDRGYIQLYCYFDDMPKKRLKAYMKVAEGIFRYREPEEFIEYSDKDIEIPLILNKKKK